MASDHALLLLQRNAQLTTLTTILSHVAVQAEGRAGCPHRPGAGWPGDAFPCHMLTEYYMTLQLWQFHRHSHAQIVITTTAIGACRHALEQADMMDCQR